ncbi:MAG: hypothetical protein BAW33_09195 [Desulfobacterales bacterium C00003104]|nr:MAG: hypothetical protein BAW33_09165 [Desulfobacterales bacterium C00003104]OEU60935.1 MAG: hypothetical protein BAW33_09195 [Desulfobacterales bacterium C00003104]
MCIQNSGIVFIKISKNAKNRDFEANLSCIAKEKRLDLIVARCLKYFSLLPSVYPPQPLRFLLRFCSIKLIIKIGKIAEKGFIMNLTHITG